jgi:hypothetical protein
MNGSRFFVAQIENRHDKTSGQDFAHKRALILAASALGRTLLGLEADHAELDLAVAGEAVSEVTYDKPLRPTNRS